MEAALKNTLTSLSSKGKILLLIGDGQQIKGDAFSMEIASKIGARRFSPTSLFVSIMAYTDQTTIADAWNYNVHYSNSANSNNAALSKTRIPQFVCPSGALSQLLAYSPSVSSASLTFPSPSSIRPSDRCPWQ